MILVFGKSGQVATELARQGDVLCLGRDVCDLSVTGNVVAAIAAHQPTAVINAAAYTAVDQAEDDEAAALQINGHAVAEMADACAKLNIPLVHISTDYVFAGDGIDPWQSTDPTSPLGTYGRTKLAGEDAVRASGVTHAILRTSWVFSAHGNNFLKTMLRLGADRDALTIVADQIGGPTPAADIAAACLMIAGQLKTDPNTGGTYHFAGAPDVSWADFARAIFDQAGITCDVTDIPSSDYPTPAARPLNSRMDCSSIHTTFNIPRPDWRQGITDILKDLSL
ncbi:MAG: dTDP-4-dehydrorhamnose reductase [Planktomarina sp.]